MNAVVIYESYFGNTRQIAEAVSDGLKRQCRVHFFAADEVDMEIISKADLVVAGSATRKFQPGETTRKFLAKLKKEQLAAGGVAAFDTRIDAEEVDSRLLKFFMKFGGYAAEKIGKRLGRICGIKDPETAGFIVEDTEGPLRDGELERAARWGERLVANAARE